MLERGGVLRSKMKKLLQPSDPSGLGDWFWDPKKKIFFFFEPRISRLGKFFEPRIFWRKIFWTEDFSAQNFFFWTEDFSAQKNFCQKNLGSRGERKRGNRWRRPPTRVNPTPHTWLILPVVYASPKD